MKYMNQLVSEITEKSKVKKEEPKQSDEIEKLKRELKVTDELLNERQRLLDAIPECEAHGKCVPHAIDWIEIKKSKLHTSDELLTAQSKAFYAAKTYAYHTFTDYLNSLKDNK